MDDIKFKKKAVNDVKVTKSIKSLVNEMTKF